jgi:hypothetical protein
MKTVTLKTLVLKTATVGSVKLPTPADRIGLGVRLVVATYPADVLSSGQFPLPPNPEPENGSGSRQEPSAPQLHEQMRAMAPAVPPAGPAGCLRVPGSSACRRPSSFTGRNSELWRGATKRAAAAGRLTTDAGLAAVSVRVRRAATQSRTSFPAGLSLPTRCGRDCQSPDRRDDRWPATRNLATATAAGK